jgi:hypothetical protein
MAKPRSNPYIAFTSRNGFHQFSLDDYSQLTSLVKDQPALFNGDYVFRGQRNALWRLESSLTRRMREVPLDDHARLRRKHLEAFCRQLRATPELAEPNILRRVLEEGGEVHATTFSSASGQRKVRDSMLQDEVDIWSIGQHNGLDTPLLDWSRVLLYAVFFAAWSGDSSRESSLCAVYALNTRLVRERTEELREQSRPEFLDLVEPIAGERRRIVAQNGLFSICSGNLPVERWVTASFAEPQRKELPVLLKFIFPRASARCLDDLKIHGITHARLMPDIDGICRETNYNLKEEISHA